MMVVVAGIAFVGGCSSGHDASGPGGRATVAPSTRSEAASTTLPDATAADETTPATTSTVAPSTTQPAQPGFDLSSESVAPVPDGAGVAAASAIQARPFDGAEIPELAADYSETEFLVSGIASTYSGPANRPAVAASTGTRYVTRVLVRAPSDPSRFSGRVVMEPFNTSGSADADVVWMSVGSMLEAEGDAWVGVTVRSSSLSPLRQFDPVRYADLVLATNTWSGTSSGTLVGCSRRAGIGVPAEGPRRRHCISPATPRVVSTSRPLHQR